MTCDFVCVSFLTCDTPPQTSLSPFLFHTCDVSNIPHPHPLFGLWPTSPSVLLWSLSSWLSYFLLSMSCGHPWPISSRRTITLTFLRWDVQLVLAVALGPPLEASWIWSCEREWTVLWCMQLHQQDTNTSRMLKDPSTEKQYCSYRKVPSGPSQPRGSWMFWIFPTEIFSCHNSKLCFCPPEFWVFLLTLRDPALLVIFSIIKINYKIQQGWQGPLKLAKQVYKPGNYAQISPRMSKR